MATAYVVLLVSYFTSVHAGILTNTAWGILEQVNPRFVEEDMRDPFLNWYMAQYEDEFKTDSPTETFLVEEYGFSIYVIRIGDERDEAVVRQSIDYCPGFIEHCLLNKPVGIEIIRKKDATFDSATSSGSAGNQLLIIGVSQAFIHTGEKSISLSNESRDYFHIQKIDREAQNWANVYSTKGANCGKPRKILEILDCISGIEIILLPTAEMDKCNDDFLSVAKQEVNGKRICAVGWDIGRVVKTKGPSPVSNNLYYITIVVRTGVSFQRISNLSEMPFWKTITLSREFLYTLAPPSTSCVLQRRKELENLIFEKSGLNSEYKELVQLKDDFQEAAMEAVHKGKNCVSPQYIAISETFIANTTIGYVLRELSSNFCLANNEGAPCDISGVIPFGIFWDYIPNEGKFNLTIAFPGELGKTG